jgi:hypothetical protein
MTNNGGGDMEGKWKTHVRGERGDVPSGKGTVVWSGEWRTGVGGRVGMVEVVYSERGGRW